MKTVHSRLFFRYPWGYLAPPPEHKTKKVLLRSTKYRAAVLKLYTTGTVYRTSPSAYAYVWWAYLLPSVRALIGLFFYAFHAAAQRVSYPPPKSVFHFFTLHAVFFGCVMEQS